MGVRQFNFKIERDENVLQRYCLKLCTPKKVVLKKNHF